MNHVIGRVCIRIDGEVRELACDMRAVAVLWHEIGDDWPAWLTERFAGVVMPAPDGTEVRMAAQIPPADLGLALYALLASDRAERRVIESPASILDELDAAGMPLGDFQVAAMDAVAPSFGVHGKGLEREPKRKAIDGKRKRKPKAWDWRLILETGLGLMGLSPDTFWRMTLAEWRCMHDGYVARHKRYMRARAWSVSYLLSAQGADPDKVRPAKLLGEVDAIERKHRREIRNAVQKMKTRRGPDPELLRLAHEATRGAVGADLIAKQQGGESGS